jgi:hypothetical protein
MPQAEFHELTPTKPARGPAKPAWWTSPRVLAGFVVFGAVLLALRKPWALHTPQFWAEDGEIFMNQDDAMGWRALLHPYNGYLHLLPRLIAWVASRSADVAWWPAIYNGLAFVITVGLFARIASPRIELPGKPWLILAFAAVAGSGEALINVTNLQWITAFFLLVQLFAARPVTPWQRLGDYTILVLTGLNGPFAILLLPLFAWRAWRERNFDRFAEVGVVALCAIVQASFLPAGGLSLEAAARPADVMNGAVVLANRLVIWPALGPAAARTLPGWASIALGVAVIVPLFVWALRPHPRRAIRAPVIAALLLVLAASVYRARPDTWMPADLVNADRYFYIPRVLVAWLLIWELDAAPRAIAWLARGLCILGLVTHAPHFVLPAPPDYRWTENCDPIRRGEPADILTLPEGYWIEYRGRPNNRQ